MAGAVIVRSDPSARRAGQLRLVASLVALLAAAGCIASSILTWLKLPDGAGGMTFVSGWGTISGGSQIAGENINNAMNGNATFRPGTLALIVGVFALLAAVGIALVGRGRTPHRVPAAVLTLCGLGGLAWGILRGIRPDSAGVLDPGEGSSGTGPWLLAGCSLVLLIVAVTIFAGVLDPPGPQGSRERRRR